jgi:hypothetical protein
MSTEYKVGLEGKTGKELLEGLKENGREIFEATLKGRDTNGQHVSVWYDDRTDSAGLAVMSSSNWSFQEEDAKHNILLYSNQGYGDDDHFDYEYYVEKELKANGMNNFLAWTKGAIRKELEEIQERNKGRYAHDFIKEVADAFAKDEAQAKDLLDCGFDADYDDYLEQKLEENLKGIEE